MSTAEMGRSVSEVATASLSAMARDGGTIMVGWRGGLDRLILLWHCWKKWCYRRIVIVNDDG